ncbi:hypothetical protein JCM18916_3318 [Cutibacterium acnes JCM 18916]|nr:hypothetical protein JCM18916_3318 [Cutibacterium acnes JCM 18916]
MNARAAVAVTVLLVVAGCAPSHGGAVPEPFCCIRYPGSCRCGDAGESGVQIWPPELPASQGTGRHVTVDHVNNITLLTGPDTSGKVHDFLADNLSASGFTVTGNADGSLTFISNRGDTKGWSGGFTSSDEAAGLTLRHG